MTSHWNTAGAVTVKNAKGELTMKKVKVHRYVAGKRPDYARNDDDNSSSGSEFSGNADDEHLKEEEEEMALKFDKERESNVSNWLANKSEQINENDIEFEDRRLRRLQERESALDASYEDRVARHRKIHEPEVLLDDDKMDLDEESQESDEKSKGDAECEEDNDDEEERMRHRLALRQKALEKQAEEELLKREEEQKVDKEASEERGDDNESDNEDDEEEEEEETEDEVAPRLKPVFVSKQDRVTILEREREAQKQRQIELENLQLHEESRKHTRKIIEDEIKRELKAEKETDEKIACDFLTDDENDELEYEAWKLRELKRIKRDREEKEARDLEREQIARLRNMTEDERLAELKKNPKFVTNLREKGNYKFMQKYYHRGAYFMHEEQEVYKRNVTEPTLEDHFDKSVLPKVMQVKNFGLAGRTKYTHLVDQDTTRPNDNPWKSQEDGITQKYGAGMKQVFDRPSARKRKN